MHIPTRQFEQRQVQVDVQRSGLEAYYIYVQGTGLTLALYSYLGQALLPSLQDLKPVQLKELTEAFQAMDVSPQPGGSGKPTRFTRKQAREMEAAASSGVQQGDLDDAEPGMPFRYDP